MRGVSSLFSHLMSLGVGFAIMAMISMSMANIYVSETEKSAKVGFISAAETIAAEIEDICLPDYSDGYARKVIAIPRKIGGKIYSIRLESGNLMLMSDDAPHINATRPVFCDAAAEAGLYSKDEIEIILRADSTGKSIQIL